MNYFVQVLLSRRRWFVAIVQAFLISTALSAAWLLRFDFQLRNPQLLLRAGVVLVAIRLCTMPFFKLMHGWWQYTGVSDALDVGKAALTGSVLFFLVLRYGFRATSFPVSIYVMECLLTFMLLSGIRLLSRVLADSFRERAHCKRLLLVGAGHAAQMIIRETQQVANGCMVVGCLDDDPLKQHMKILGIPILGTVDQVGVIARDCDADEVLIAIPSATNKQMRRFVETCDKAGVGYRTVPGLTELIAGEVSLGQAREVRLEDLLGRKPVKLDLTSVRNAIQGRVVMVTGAAGSIGSELCRQILSFNPANLVCVDQNETGMFYLRDELLRTSKSTQLVFCIGDVSDVEHMRKIFVRNGVNIVFHAAAYKHVPLMEANVEEAVDNNIFGLLSLLQVAQDAKCSSFVLISSDKAVNPSSVMGCTKRICELILAAWPANGLRCVSVRFGNVLGSSGSVVPVFRGQIRNGQPITITHPDINRFFMTIPEAVSLVLQASVVGRHGNIMVLDMGEPMRILDLAETLIRLSGKSKDQVKIKFTGLRPGEKLFEELFYDNEKIVPTACEKVKCTQGAVLSWPELQRHLEELRASTLTEGSASVRQKLKQIVPQFDSPTEEAHTLPELPQGKIAYEANKSVSRVEVFYRNSPVALLEGISPASQP